MTSLSATPEQLSLSTPTSDARLAAAITRASSKQSYYIIRWLVERSRMDAAYRAYAYFRWVDDHVDDVNSPWPSRAAFLARQQELLVSSYRGRLQPDLSPEEWLLSELATGDAEPASGLRAYLEGMMAVMAFDLERCGRLISAAELEGYTRLLAAAVTDALLYFTAPDRQESPDERWRDHAVQGACIIHMLRDTLEDAAAGYYNISAEYLAEHDIDPTAVHHPAYRAWVASRVSLACDCFGRGRAFLAGLESGRARLAGYAYLARFEWMAARIRRDGYWLRPAYPERKSTSAAAWMARRAAASYLGRVSG